MEKAGSRSSLVAAAVLAGAPEFCTSARVSDFNGDGFSDAAVGDPGRTVGTAAQAGAVHVLYGVAGRDGGGPDTPINQSELGETAEEGDRFGAVVRVGNLDPDYCSDLVVGVPNEDVGSTEDAGVVHVIFGSTQGLGRGRPSQLIRLGAGRVPGTPAAGDRFGAAVGMAERLSSALVIGAPGKDIGTLADAGQVTNLSYVEGHPSRVLNLTQNTPGVAGGVEAGDRFGAAVAHVSPLPHGDDGLAVGAPGEDVGSRRDAGSVTVITGLGLTPVSSVGFTQDSNGVAGAAEAGDRFGASLSSARLTTGLALLAVGVPGEDIGAIPDAGLVHVLKGPPLTDLVALGEDSPGVPGTAEAGDRFGSVLALVRGNTSEAHLAVGTPAEDRGAIVDSGAVHAFVIGPGGNSSRLFEQENFGGVSQAGDHLGAAVAYTGHGLSPTLMSGVPDDAARPAGLVYALRPARGPEVPQPPALQTWTPGQGNVPPGGASFGGSLGGVTG